MKATLRVLGPSLALFGGLMLFSCRGIGPAAFIGNCDREISDSTQDIQSANADAKRAKAYSKRGTAYSEKARYSREFKLIAASEYERLFDLAIKDHERAITLNPDSAEMYFKRGQAYYDRGNLELMDHKDGKPWFDSAVADFEIATQKTPKDSQAFDRLGLAHEENGESDKAIRAYTQEMALDSFGKQRLADAYCNRGFRLQQQANYPAAAVEYEKSIEFGIADDHDCPYEPFSSLVEIYTTETHQYDKAWEFVYKAAKSGRVMPLELMNKLVKHSGHAK